VINSRIGWPVRDFFGAALLAKTVVKSEDEILREAALRAPVEPLDSDEYKNSLRKMPNVQVLFRQSRRAKCGLWILTIGFLLQFIGDLVIVCP